MEPVLSAEIQLLAQHQATLCKVFSSAQRVLILWFLAEREHKVSEIAGALGASLPCTSQHLHLMELNGVLESRRVKQNIYYRLANNDLLRNCLVLANMPKEKLADLMLEKEFIELPIIKEKQ
jgi:ArsR family transcriptional regulator, virulence genes transcriptional regulator